MTTVYLGLGANVGDRKANMRAALDALSHGVRILSVSSLYETEAIGPPQRSYYNAVAAIETGVAPAALLAMLWTIERKLGREPMRDRDAPRSIDLDILLYGALKLASARLTVPHPRLAERAFVLVPLADIAGGVTHPTLHKTITELAREAGSDGVALIEKSGWASG